MPNYEKARKIDVEESKRQGRLVTKEVDENDPEYYKYKQAGVLKDDSDDFHLDGGINDETHSAPKGIEMYYFYMYLVFLFIPVSFVILKAFIIGGDLDFAWKIFSYVLFIVIYALGILIFPIYVIKRKDVSDMHKKRIKILMGNNLVLLMWLSVFVITPMMINLTIPNDKAKITFLLFFMLFMFDVGIQMFLLYLKTRNPRRTELCERISLALSIVTIWAYGAIICPLIFSKTVERIIFDITLLVVVILISILNMVIYKFKKKTDEVSYEYSNVEYYNASKLLLCLVLEGLVLGITCLVIICV